MTTQELVERLRSWAEDFDVQSETVDGGLHRHIFQLRAQVTRAAASRLSEMAGENEMLRGNLELITGMNIEPRSTMTANALLELVQNIARSALEHQQKGEGL